MIYLNNNTIHLQGKSTSYIINGKVSENTKVAEKAKKLADREYKAIAMKDENQCAFLPEGYTLENYRQEYPSYGYSDLKSPAYDVFNSDGNNISMLKVTDIKTNLIYNAM